MLTINELFSGIGAQVAGLKRLGIAYNVVGISEIDKFAIQSYEAINGSVRNYGDISKVPLLDYADLWTYSFPCQDLSVAGKQAGIKEGTRSGLLLEVERLLENAVLLGNQPKYLLLENVKALVSKKFKPDFDRWLSKLSELGYDNYWKVLNAKDYGVPQNRERVFVVSIRKDLNQTYMFPEPVPLTLRLKDLLESEVDEKYYLPQEKVEKLALNLNKDVSNTIRCGGGGGSLDGKHTWDVVIAASRGRNPENPSSREAGLPTEQRMEVNSSGVSNTLTTVQKDNLVVEPSILTPKRTEYGKAIRKEYEAGNIQESRHNMTEMKPRTDGVSNTLTTVQKDNLVMYQKPHGFNKGGFHDCAPTITSTGSYQENNFVAEPKINVLGNYKPSGHECGRIVGVEGVSPTIKDNHGAVYSIAEPKVKFVGNIYDNNYNSQAGRIYDAKGLSPCLDTMGGGNRQPKVFEEGIRIRKLTPKECWRLMGFTDVEFDVAQMSGVSNSQLYKQAGNSIVVDVLAAIFKELL